MRVFISSTCYDLIDLRAELEVFFRSSGVEPVMSDSLTSDFQVSADANSIQTCLANVRACDHFIIILSNRCGPTLKGAGFEDVSATHLEYLEAKKSKIPVHMYVRDRLEGDFAIWKANGSKQDLKLSWCKSDKDWPIFTLLEEHRKLTETSVNNWLWVFKHSIELKDRIRMDLKDAFASAAVTALFTSGSLPLIEVHGKIETLRETNFHAVLTLRNVGQAVAVCPHLSVVRAENEWLIPTLHPKEEKSLDFVWAYQPGSQTTVQTRLTYSTLQGYKFSDEATLTIEHASCAPDFAFSYTISSRRYIGATDAPLLMMPSFDGTQPNPI